MNGLAALTKTTTMALLLGLALYASDAVGEQAKINKTDSSEPGRSPPTLTLALGARPLAQTMEWPYLMPMGVSLSSWCAPTFPNLHPTIATKVPRTRTTVVQGSITYFGTYSVNEGDGTLTLHIVRSSFPNWNGTDQEKRLIGSLTADELKYTNPAASVGGTAELTWKQFK